MLLVVEEIHAVKKTIRSHSWRTVYLFVLYVSLLFLATVQAQPIACDRKCKPNESCLTRCSQPSTGPKISCAQLDPRKNHHNASSTLSTCGTLIHIAVSKSLLHNQVKTRYRTTKSVFRHHHPLETKHVSHSKKPSESSTSKIKYRATLTVINTKHISKATKSKTLSNSTPTAGSTVSKNKLPASSSFPLGTSSEDFSLTESVSTVTDISATLISTTLLASEIISSFTSNLPFPSEYKNTLVSQISVLPSPSADQSAGASAERNMNKGAQGITTAIEGGEGNQSKNSSNVVIPAVAGSVFGVVAVCIGLFTYYRLKRKRQLCNEREDYEAGLEKYSFDQDGHGSLQMDSLPNGILPPPPPLLDSPRQSKRGKSLYHQSVDASVHSLPQSEFSSFDDTLAKFPQPADITSWNFYTIPTVPSGPDNSIVPSENDATTTLFSNSQIDAEPSSSANNVLVAVPIPVKKKAILVDINDLKRQRSLRRAASARVHRRESSDDRDIHRHSYGLSKNTSNVQLNRSKSDRVVGQRWRNNTTIQEKGVVFKASHELLPPFTPLTASGTRARAKNFREAHIDAFSVEVSDLKVPKNTRKRYSTFGKNQGNKDLPEFGPVKQENPSAQTKMSTDSVTSFSTVGDLSDGK